MDTVKYSEEQFQTAYLAWVNAPMGSAEDPYIRQGLWDEYCDVRDKIPRGTTQKRRIKRDVNQRTKWGK